MKRRKERSWSQKVLDIFSAILRSALGKQLIATNLVFLTVLGLLLGACGKAQTPTEPSLPVVAGITPRLPTAAPTVTLEASPTSVLVMQKQGSGALGNLAGSGPVEALPSATPLPDPLRFVFPTPGPAPVSAWRPPLYPVPWAPTLVDHFYFSRPIAADEINWPSQNYRYGGEFFEDVIHTGVDIPAPQGTPVPGSRVGQGSMGRDTAFTAAERYDRPYGQAVTIRHDYGYQGETLYTVYGHLQRVDVTEGQYVESGEPIGLVGETGRVTGPHLHFEVRLERKQFSYPRAAELWVTPPLGGGAGRADHGFNREPG
jgi:murein DD-endopeptidase MepM/ murein hydrolase activator NlpD